MSDPAHQIIRELIAALEKLVERGTDSPEHKAAEGAIARAKEFVSANDP